MNPIRYTIRNLSERYKSEIITIRRHLHQYPELSFQEYETSAYIRSLLDQMQIPYQWGFAGNGIVARLESRNPQKRVIALRADMDALPIHEMTDLSYQSVHPGVMHACGHDAHMASLIGTAKILQSLKDHWEGTVLLLFQPAEEKYPGGARLLMEEGALDNPHPQLIIGQHVLPEMETGYAGFKQGTCMASGDEIYMTLQGRGGHGAMPHTLTDTVCIASHLVVALQQVVSRFVPAQIPAVLPFGRFIADGATNIIPDKVEIAGTLRMLDDEWRVKVKQHIRKMAVLLVESMGADCEVIINDGYPMVNNHVGLTSQVSQFARSYLGASKVEEMDSRMTAEDFGYYSQMYPCTFYRVGVKQSNGETGVLHSPKFNLNEESLVPSMGLMAYIAISILQKDSLPE